MVVEEINPQYEVVFEKEMYGIFGNEQTTGEKVFIEVSLEPEMVFRLADILNKNKVSVHHAKDVIKDIILSPLCN